MNEIALLASDAPSTWNPQTATLDVVWYGGSPIVRHGGVVLVFDWDGCDLSEFNASAPVIDTHGLRDILTFGFPQPASQQLGKVVAGSAVVEGSGKKRRGVCKLQLARIPETQSLIERIEQGIPPKLSMGTRLLQHELITGTDRAKEALAYLEIANPEHVDVYLVTKWKPYELSLVLFPADPLAVALSAQPAMPIPSNAQRGGTAPENSGAPAAAPATPAPNTVQATAEPVATSAAAAPAARAQAPAAPQQPIQLSARERLASHFGFTPVDSEAALGDERWAATESLAELGMDDGQRAESYRQQQIQACAATLGLSEPVWRPFIANLVPLTDARRELLSRARQAQPPVSNQISLGVDERDKVRLGVESVLLSRLGHQAQVQGFGESLRGLRFAELAREMLAREGIKVKSHEPGAVWLAMHDSSDLPKLMAAVANKSLLRAYEAASRTWMGLSRRGDAQDFKLQRRLRIDSIAPMKKLPRGAEITYGTLAESEEVYALATFATGITMTRQMVVDDDLSALSRLPELIGREAAEAESDAAWGLLLLNVVLGDGVTLFAAGHGNTGTAVLGEAGLSAMRTAMRTQKRLDGKTPLNINPKRLFVPAALETTAQKLTTSLQAQQIANVNPFQGAFELVAVEPRLDVASATGWYASANPDQFDVLEHAWLGGATGPMIEERASWTRDGLEMRALLDFGVGVLDYRGLYRSTGAG